MQKISMFSIGVDVAALHCLNLNFKYVSYYLLACSDLIFRKQKFKSQQKLALRQTHNNKENRAAFSIVSSPFVKEQPKGLEATILQNVSKCNLHSMSCNYNHDRLQDNSYKLKASDIKEQPIKLSNPEMQMLNIDNQAVHSVARYRAWRGRNVTLPVTTMSSEQTTTWRLSAIRNFSIDTPG